MTRDSEAPALGQDAHHWVLLRQLKRAGLTTHAPPTDQESWRFFLERVSSAYLESDKQQYLHDRAVEVSTREMASLYDELAQASESSLALQRDWLQTVFDAAPSGLMVLDAAATVIDVNPSAERLLGITEHSANGQPLRQLLGDGSATVTDLQRACEQGRDWLDPDTEIWTDSRAAFPAALQFVPLVTRHSTGGGVLSILDLSERKRIEQDLSWRATHDVLTRVLNRSALLDRVALGIARAERDGSPRAVLFLDLDRFKAINDSLGHAAGDRLLMQVATRLSGAIRDVDALARIGGDEFVILLDGIASLSAVELVAKRVMAALAPPYVLGEPYEDPVFASASIGVAVAESGSSPTSLLRDADFALYAAKRAGRDQHVVFDSSMRDEVAVRVRMEKLLRAAVSRGDLHMAFQPVFSMSGGALLGFEALLRWTDRDGPIPPSEFIPLAEETGLIQRIGAIALDIGVSFAAALGQLPMGESLTVSVNISGLQVSHGDLSTQVADALARHRVDGSRLILELTETALLSDPKTVAGRMQAISDQGVELALDDFGTGFSSLTSLREFPLAALKVDRMFTRNVDTSDRDRAIVAAVVALGHALGLSVVAEGVETAHHMTILTEMGCDAGQGFYFGRPLAWESALALAAAWGAPAHH